jgi:NADH-quinone oxidoreductase subunit F
MANIASVKQLNAYRKKVMARKPPGRKAIAVCAGTGCKAFGSFELIDAFKEALAKHGLTEKVELRATGCHGFCERGPLVLYFPKGWMYQRVKPEDAEEIVAKSAKQGKYVSRLAYEDPVTGKKHRKQGDIPFYKHQQRLVLEQNGHIDPTSVDDYIALGGYEALSRTVSMNPEEIIEEVKASGLRGRGGAGFLTGKKWEICRSYDSDKRYLVCNADEGDPGAFMDRSILEGNPHSVIEGMVIGALAMGADEGHVYVRQEYPLAVERLQIALEQARDLGVLGEDILGTSLSFDIKVNRGGGAFVCGEESAMIASIEGSRGVPRKRPPYPAESGLWGKPTNINNVETWANVPLILKNGAAWYASIGTKGSKGTKIFSLVGKVNNTGLVEVPMGMTLRDIIEKIGGGIPGKKRFKAVQTGGPSGGCLPEEKLDTPVDFDTLAAQGSMMGSGGMIVMDEETCMIDVAKYFLNFLKFESCGNCTSCRDGLERLHQLLTDISEGRGTDQTLHLIEELSETVRETSLCALGSTAVNPVKSTLEHFREEYEAHIRHNECPAKVCKELITFTIDPDGCIGCMLCAKRCPSDAIEGKRKEPHIILQEDCIKCGVCRDVCPEDAVIVE